MSSGCFAVLSAMWEEMSLYKKHRMRTLPEVFYPALAAVGLPFKCRLPAGGWSANQKTLFCFMALRMRTLFIYKLGKIPLLTLSLSQHHHLSGHFEEEPHALQIFHPLPEGNFHGRPPFSDLHRVSWPGCVRSHPHMQNENMRSKMRSMDHGGCFPFQSSFRHSSLLVQCIDSLEQNQMYLHPRGPFFLKSTPDLASNPSILQITPIWMG